METLKVVVIIAIFLIAGFVAYLAGYLDNEYTSKQKGSGEPVVKKYLTPQQYCGNYYVNEILFNQDKQVYSVRCSKQLRKGDK